MLVAKCSAVVVGVMSIVLALGAQRLNVAFLGRWLLQLPLRRTYLYCC